MFLVQIFIQRDMLGFGNEFKGVIVENIKRMKVDGGGDRWDDGMTQCLCKEKYLPSFYG